MLENVESLNAVLQVANRIQNTLSQPFYLEENQIFTGASIGIVLCGSQQQAAEESWQKSEEKYLASSSLKIPETAFPHCVLPNPITYHEKPEEILGCISILILPKIRRFLGMGNGEWGIAKNVFLQI